MSKQAEKMKNGPLQGLRITEFTSAWAGPYATCLLGFLGAEVIKVESKKRIDHSRFIAFTTGKSFSTPDESSVFNNLNLNKQSVTLNLTKPKAVEIAKRLTTVSDIVVENMRPGVVPRLGLGYEVLKEIKPDLIYLSSSACGQTGPWREYVGYAPTFAAMAGLPFITGYDDWPPSNFMGSIDLRSATTAAFAILTALLYRQKTGEGQYIDLSSQESIAVLTGEVFLDYVMNNKVRTRQGNRHEFMAPHNCYKCKGENNWISIAVATDQEWQALTQVMEKPELVEDARFSDGQNRWNNQDELDSIINEWTEKHDYYEIMEKLQKVGVAAGPSLSGEGLFKDKHLKQREVFMTVDHPVIGKDWIITPPWKLSATPASIPRHAPILGEHNETIFKGLLGMSQEEINQLSEEEVIF
ncbi:MAG: CoA transferase [Deltaproteobacteria bacterium]|nr:CoA transferase [Deltaproteobacteria bacterium]